MAFQPADHLTNRTFVGLIVAQFLAGFNDQAIHAAAMFYAINKKVLSEAGAITLMPILFYAPWAIFCTLAGYLADRHSKTYSLVTWKIAEIVISLVLLLGLYLGSGLDMRVLGVSLVMSCVFLMGTHAAFFAPAKYGAMPEVLRPHVLSRGNGILESTTFLASILGTVAGGSLISYFHGREEWIGVILLILSLIGAAASLMIAHLPAANPARLFPKNPFKPLLQNLKVIFQSRPLMLSALGIAFFIFMVSYMRAAVYMHGETRNPRWEEWYTSLVVATVALGVGIGSPLAGYLSGGKVELGLVPLGCLGMIAALVLAGVAIEIVALLVLALVVIGFFSGFYMVPLYTLLQHRAPKTSKGDLIATSNFINVTGAITATLLFGLLVLLSRVTGIAPEVSVTDEATGTLEKVVTAPMVRKGLAKLIAPPREKVIEIEVRKPDGALVVYRAKNVALPKKPLLEVPEDQEGWGDVFEDLLHQAAVEQEIEFNDNLLELLGGQPQKGDEVTVSTYKLRGVDHYLVRPADQADPPRVYDKEYLPRFLFLGAAFLTLGIMLLLWSKLPDFFVRSLFWLRSLRRFRVRAAGMQHLPTSGPVLLATNAHTLDGSLELVSATDRATKVVLVEEGPLRGGGRLLRALARRFSLIELREGEITPEAWERARTAARQTLGRGHLLAVSVGTADHADEVEAFLRDLHTATGAPVLPVFCGSLDPAEARTRPESVRVIFGAALPDGAALTEVRKAIEHLAEHARTHDDEH